MHKQTNIIDRATMTVIITGLERNKIICYLRSAVCPEVAGMQAELEEKYEGALAEMEGLRAEMEETRTEIEDRDWEG